MKNINYKAGICIAAILGFMLGRVVHPVPVKAANPPRIVHVNAPPTDWAVVPEYAYGTPTAISCVSTDCYVLIQGN